VTLGKENCLYYFSLVFCCCYFICTGSWFFFFMPSDSLLEYYLIQITHNTDYTPPCSLAHVISNSVIRKLGSNYTFSDTCCWSVVVFVQMTSSILPQSCFPIVPPSLPVLFLFITISNGYKIQIRLFCVCVFLIVNDIKGKQKILGSNQKLKFNPTELILYCKDFRIIRFRFDEAGPESAKKVLHTQ